MAEDGQHSATHMPTHLRPFLSLIAVSILARLIGAEPVSYERDIAPLLKEHCIACHGETRAKGKLRLHDPGSILLGGANGPVISGGAPEMSPLVLRIELPEDDDDHMPPKKQPKGKTKSQPMNADQVALIRRWVLEGAVMPARMPGTVTKAEILRPGDPVDKATIRLLQRQGFQVEDLDEGGLSVSCISGPIGMNRAPIDELAYIGLLIRQLHVSNSVTGQELSTIAGFANLERLYLHGMKPTQADLDRLSTLGKLKLLSLSNSDADDQVVPWLTAHPSLKTVYLIRTGVSDDAIAKLRHDRADLRVIGNLQEMQPSEQQLFGRMMFDGMPMGPGIFRRPRGMAVPGLAGPGMPARPGMRSGEAAKEAGVGVDGGGKTP